LNVNARLIISARLISDFGAFLNMVALATYVYLLSNSAMSVGVFLASRVGGDFCQPDWHRFYRRWNGRMPLIAFDLLRAVLLGLLLILPVSQQALLLPVIAFGLGFGNSMFAIGLNSQLPRLIEAAQLLKTNAWITSASSAAMVGGSLVSGLLVAAFGFETVFALNALTYLLAALLIAPLRFAAADVSEQSTNERGEWSALKQGLRSASGDCGDARRDHGRHLGQCRAQRRLPDHLQTADTRLGQHHARPDAGGVGQRQTAGCADCQWPQRFDNRDLERRYFFGVALMSCGFILMFQQHSLRSAAVFPAGGVG
jgi:MFS family permease